MKRISLLAALLALTPGVAGAYYGYGVRYSPYALSYYSSGLVRDDANYTPYALKYYGSGLVPGYGIYPYAFPAFVVPLRHTVFPVHRVPSVAQSSNGTASQTPSPASVDPMNTIRQHLYAKGYGAVTVDRILRVDNQLVSVDVHVPNRNLLIKYWNPQAAQQLAASASSKGIIYTRYKESWERYAQQYQQKGGAVYQINASEPQAIVAALDSCPQLGPGHDIQTPAVLYAKE